MSGRSVSDGGHLGKQEQVQLLRSPYFLCYLYFNNQSQRFPRSSRWCSLLPMLGGVRGGGGGEASERKVNVIQVPSGT